MAANLFYEKKDYKKFKKPKKGSFAHGINIRLYYGYSVSVEYNIIN